MNDPEAVSDQAKTAFVQTRDELLKYLQQYSDLATILLKAPMPSIEDDVTDVTSAYEGFLIEEGFKPAIKKILDIIKFGETFSSTSQFVLQEEIKESLELIKAGPEVVKAASERARRAKWEAERIEKKRLKRSSESAAVEVSGRRKSRKLVPVHINQEWPGLSQGNEGAQEEEEFVMNLTGA